MQPGSGPTRVTIRDVAQQAGVGLQTVSNVLNGTGHVAEKTRVRVDAAIESLGYHRHWSAHSLRSRRVKQLGYLVADASTRYLGRPYHQEVLAGLAEAARRADHALVIVGSSDASAKQLAQPLLEGRIDGAVVSASGRPSTRRALVSALDPSRFPIVLLDEASPPKDCASVLGDDENGVGEAVQHLLARGHRRVAMLCSSADWPDVDAKIRGLRAGLREAAGQAKGTVVRVSANSDGRTAAAAHDAFERLMRRNGSPTGIIAAGDEIVAGVLRGARALGLQIPHDVALIGIEDEFVASLVETPLTAVEIPRFRMGVAAGELLLDRLVRGEFRERTSYVRAQLIVRGST